MARVEPLRDLIWCCCEPQVPLRGEDLKTLGEFTVNAGETVPFILPTLASRRSADENGWSIWALEATLGGKLGAVVTSFEYIHASLGGPKYQTRYSRLPVVKISLIVPGNSLFSPKKFPALLSREFGSKPPKHGASDPKIAPELKRSLFFSLLAGNLGVETGSTTTASATTFHWGALTFR